MACLICLRPLTNHNGDYHTRCVKALFGSRSVPELDIKLAKLHTVALAMVGRTSLSGVQRKISLTLSSDRARLQVATGTGLFVLKPPTEVYPELPQNELLTMRFAELVDIDIATCGLVRLTDGALAFISRRFDRVEGGAKLHQEDFCQLAERPPKEKYGGSAELCARVVRTYANEPLVEQLRLFRRMAFTWLSGNGDMHLKNFSLLRGPDGLHRLSPAYDLLCTRLAIPDDQLALPVGGKRDNLTRADWLNYAAYCTIPRPAAERALGKLLRAVNGGLQLIARSMLSEAAKTTYADLLGERAETLRG